MTIDKQVDESWKDNAHNEKEILIGQKNDPAVENTSDLHIPNSIHQENEAEHQSASQNGSELNFLNYITSLGFQAMIFLGVIPNPMTEKEEKNLEQAKFLIDTLALLKEKTQGNLTKEEDNLLNASLYELQLKYVETIQNESKT